MEPLTGIPAGTWLLGVLAFLTVTFAVLSFAMLWEGWQGRRRYRSAMEQLRKMTTEAGGAATGVTSALRSASLSDAAWMQPLARRVPHLRDIQTTLEQAELPWTVQMYLVRAFGFGAAGGIGTLIVSGRFLWALGAAACMAAVPYLYVRQRRKRRLNAFEEQLPEAIDLLSRAIRAGHPLSSGLKMVADESADPIATEFRRVFEEQRFGLPFDDSLLAMVDRVPLVDTRILITAILIQREVGGNLAEILDNLAYVIRQRFTILRQLRVYTAQGRFSGYVLAVLPIAVGLAMLAINPDYILTLVRHPMGRMMLGTAATMQILGYLWIRRIVNIEI